MAKTEKTPRPLNVTQKGNHRVFVGLGWDPSVDRGIKARVREMVGGAKTYHDLDLSCFLFDTNKKCIDVISAKSDELSDVSGKIYHSGDDMEGIGGGDDEQISVEFKGLPDTIAYIVFKASIESGHSFDEIEAPEMRLVDAYSDRELLTADLTRDGKASAYIFVTLSRKSDGKWSYVFHDHFCKTQSLSKWKKALVEFL
jgi:stress response protein SCP2